MGWLDILNGPQWAEGIEAGLLKEKGKAPPKEPMAPKAPGKNDFKKTAGPAKKKSAPASKVPDPNEMYDPGEDLTPPPEDKRSVPQTADVSDFFGGDAEGGQQQFSTDELGELLKMLSQERVDLPEFDLGMKSAFGDITPEQLMHAPIDVRPLSAFMDDIYGTKMHARTLDLPAEYFKKLQAVQQLREGSRALQQVKGQAALEKYKVDLQQLTGGSPLQRSQALLNMVKARAGGGGGGMNPLQMAQFLRAIQQDNRGEQNRAEDRNQDRTDKQRDRVDKLQNEMGQSIEKSFYPVIRDGIINSRKTLMNPKSGTADVVSITNFLKTLDANSVVMLSEAQNLSNAVGFVDQWKQKFATATTGERVTPRQRLDMLKILANFEYLNNQKLRAIVREYNGRARQQNLPPRDVTEPKIRGAIVPDTEMHFKLRDKEGKVKNVRTWGKKYLDFLKETEGMGLEPVGTK